MLALGILVDLVGIEPTTFPVNRDALRAALRGRVSEWKHETSSFSAGARACEPRAQFQNLLEKPTSMALCRGLKTFVRAGAQQAEPRRH
jgi:hypothetical protein